MVPLEPFEKVLVAPAFLETEHGSIACTDCHGGKADTGNKQAAHAGMEPERGINAIRAASEAISALELGRLDHETTANVGVIEGGIIMSKVLDSSAILPSQILHYRNYIRLVFGDA